MVGDRAAGMAGSSGDVEGARGGARGRAARGEAVGMAGGPVRGVAGGGGRLAVWGLARTTIGRRRRSMVEVVVEE